MGRSWCISKACGDVGLGIAGCCAPGGRPGKGGALRRFSYMAIGDDVDGAVKSPLRHETIAPLAHVIACNCLITIKIDRAKRLSGHATSREKRQCKSQLYQISVSMTRLRDESLTAWQMTSIRVGLAQVTEVESGICTCLADLPFWNFNAKSHFQNGNVITEGTKKSWI